MELDEKDKIKKKDIIINFLNNNKIKIIVLITSFIIFFIASIILEINKDKKNKLIAENFIQAGLLLNSGKKEESLKYFEKIIESNNKFYSILALNTIVEKNLISDHEKIIGYFSLIEKKLRDEEQTDLLKFKKALYFMKNEKGLEGEKLLKELIKKNSKFKKLSEEFIKK